MSAEAAPFQGERRLYGHQAVATVATGPGRILAALAAYVRTHPDQDRGKRVNSLVTSQRQTARYLEDERPDRETFEDSPLREE